MWNGKVAALAWLNGSTPAGIFRSLAEMDGPRGELLRMADVVIMHAPRDRIAAQAVASSLPDYRVVTVPVIGRRANYALGKNMILMALWSNSATSPRVAPALTTLLGESPDPVGLILCDDTPLPAMSLNHASIQISLAVGGADRGAFQRVVRELEAAKLSQIAPEQAPRKQFGFAGRVVAVTGMAALSVAAVASPHLTESGVASAGDLPESVATSPSNLAEAAPERIVEVALDVAPTTSPSPVSHVQREQLVADAPVETDFASLLLLHSSPAAELAPPAPLSPGPLSIAEALMSEPNIIMPEVSGEKGRSVVADSGKAEAPSDAMRIEVMPTTK